VPVAAAEALAQANRSPSARLRRRWKLAGPADREELLIGIGIVTADFAPWTAEADLAAALDRFGGSRRPEDAPARL
jgi:hypothetical protein